MLDDEELEELNEENKGYQHRPAFLISERPYIDQPLLILQLITATASKDSAGEIQLLLIPLSVQNKKHYSSTKRVRFISSIFSGKLVVNLFSQVDTGLHATCNSV